MLGLNLLLLLGAGAVFVGIFRLFAPGEEKEEIVDISVRRYKSASSFARRRSNSASRSPAPTGRTSVTLS